MSRICAPLRQQFWTRKYAGWLLATELSIGALKNLLVQKMGKLDTLLIVDASHDKLTWANLGMETETRIRRIWSKQTQPEQSAA